MFKKRILITRSVKEKLRIIKSWTIGICKNVRNKNKNNMKKKTLSKRFKYLVREYFSAQLRIYFYHMPISIFVCFAARVAMHRPTSKRINV